MVVLFLCFVYGWYFLNGVGCFLGNVEVGVLMGVFSYLGDRDYDKSDDR